MSEDPEDFATLFAREEARRSIQVGQVVTGRILHIDEETVFVDVGGKGEALIDRAELVDAQGNLTVAVGDPIEATVVRSGETIRLSHRLLAGAQARQGLAVAAETGLPVEGKVAGVVKGGYEVTVAGLRAFCPFSQMDRYRVDDAEALVGRVLEFRISRYGEGGRNIVLSRFGSVFRKAATLDRVALPESRVLGRGGSSSRTMRRISSNAACLSFSLSNGVVPVSSS